MRGSREGKARILQNDDSYYWMVADGPRPEWHINWSGRLGADMDLSIPLQNGNELSLGYHPQLLMQDGVFEFDTLDVGQNEWNPYTRF